MNTTVFDPTEHYIAIKTEHAGDKVVRCECGWESKGFLYHPRAELAGQRHVKEQAA